MKQKRSSKNVGKESVHRGENTNPKNNKLDKNENYGPNINLKVMKKTYATQSEKNYFFSKIKKKKKTELCKNYEFYHKCYFGNKCSFAHGIEELRQYNPAVKYKDIPCCYYTEKFFCPYGQRCNYIHNSYIYEQLSSSIILHIFHNSKRLPVFESIVQSI